MVEGLERGGHAGDRVLQAVVTALALAFAFQIASGLDASRTTEDRRGESLAARRAFFETRIRGAGLTLHEASWFRTLPTSAEAAP